MKCHNIIQKSEFLKKLPFQNVVLSTFSKLVSVRVTNKVECCMTVEDMIEIYPPLIKN